MFSNFKPGRGNEAFNTIAGKFSTTTSGAVTGASTGKGWSVAKNGTGLYDITFDANVSAEIAHFVSLEEADDPAANVFYVVQSEALASKVLTVRTISVDAAGGTAAAADISGLTVHFQAMFRNFREG